MPWLAVSKQDGSSPSAHLSHPFSLTSHPSTSLTAPLDGIGGDGVYSQGVQSGSYISVLYHYVCLYVKNIYTEYRTDLISYSNNTTSYIYTHITALTYILPHTDLTLKNHHQRALKTMDGWDVRGYAWMKWGLPGKRDRERCGARMRTQTQRG